MKTRLLQVLFNRLVDYSQTSRPLGTMKIFHALVGYLAVISLPYPFAFASPLAIHYDSDGYVNSTATQNTIDRALMEHFLGTIVETCQMDTTHWKKHGDTSRALMKRIPGDIQVIEARQVEITIGFPEVAIISAIILSVALAGAWISYDNPVRCNVEFPVKNLIKSLLPETCSVYPKFYLPGVCKISTPQLGYLPLLLFHRV